MKNNYSKFIVFSVLLLAVLGCSLVGKIKEEVEKSRTPQVLTDTEGKFQLTVPGNWKTETVLNDEATLQASNRFGELYAAVIRESREDFAEQVDINFVTDIVRENLQKVSSDTVMTEPTAININGYNARQFEASATVENIKAKYVYAIVETPGNYYQIITWTIASRYEKGRDALLGVINSFKELENGGSVIVAPPAPPAAPRKK